MEIFLCDKCDTLATLSVVGDTITGTKMLNAFRYLYTPEAE
jgi:hypothetical protein